MNRSEGKIGRQETAALTGIAVYMSTVFTIPEEAYANGNSSYIWLPVGILAALGATLVIMAAMKKRDTDNLCGMLNESLGGVAGRAAAITVMLLLLWNTVTLASTFIDMMHAFEYSTSGYWNIALWGFGTVTALNILGFEGLARTAKCMLLLLLLTFLATVMLPLKAASTARLHPFPGNTAGEMGRYALASAYRAFGATIAATATAREAQGVRFAKNSCVIATAIAAAFAGITQFVIAVTFQYKDLEAIYMPIYRLDMMLVREGYFFRPDTILLFLWLIGSFIAAAYYLYAASLIWRRSFPVKNGLPVVTMMCVLLGCAVLLKYEAYYDEWMMTNAFLEKWGWCIILPPFVAAVIGVLKKPIKKEADAK